MRETSHKSMHEIVEVKKQTGTQLNNTSTYLKTLLV